MDRQALLDQFGKELQVNRMMDNDAYRRIGHRAAEDMNRQAIVQDVARYMFDSKESPVSIGFTSRSHQYNSVMWEARAWVCSPQNAHAMIDKAYMLGYHDAACEARMNPYPVFENRTKISLPVLIEKDGTVRGIK